VSLDATPSKMYASAVIAFTHLYTADGALWRARIRIIIVQFADDY